MTVGWKSINDNHWLTDKLCSMALSALILHDDPGMPNSKSATPFFLDTFSILFFKEQLIVLAKRLRFRICFG